MAVDSRLAARAAGAAEVPEPETPVLSVLVLPVLEAPAPSVLEPVLEKPQVVKVASLHSGGKGQQLKQGHTRYQRTLSCIPCTLGCCVQRSCRFGGACSCGCGRSTHVDVTTAG